MASRILCQTLFDITQTGVAQRRQPSNLTEEQFARWNIQHRQQANYDTVLQVVSLRSQPEVVVEPHCEMIELNSDWGFEFDNAEGQQKCWMFEFTVQHASVFNNLDGELGTLDLDCEDVPMITGLSESMTLPQFLSTTPELRNIKFSIINEQE